MLSVPANTAILLFAHAAEHEVKSKTFASGHSARANQKVAKALLKHTLKTIRKAALPAVTVFTGQQKGKTFGERLANAFKDAFQAGYRRVICVGSDCPTLAPADLLRAQEALQEHQMVVGPATDGGAYLIGMQVDSFDPEAFAQLNWQTEQVLQELSQYALRQQVCPKAFALLQEKADIDSKEDLEFALQQLPVHHRLRKLILSILSKGAAQAHAFRELLLHPFDKLISALLLRAPPVQAH